MDKDTLPKYPAILKHSHENQAQVTQLLYQMETLLEEILEKDLSTYPVSKLHDLLLTNSVLLQEAKKLSESLQKATTPLEQERVEKDRTNYSLSKLHEFLLRMDGLLQEAIQLSESLPNTTPLLKETPD